MTDIYENIGFIAEFLTIIISMAGIIISLHHGAFFNNQKSILSIRLRKNFLWDAAVYAVTFFMGVGLYYELTWMVKIDIIIRPIVLFFAVWASMRLYKHYRQINK